MTANLTKNLITLSLSILLSIILAEVLIATLAPQDLVKVKLDPYTVHRPIENTKLELVRKDFHTISKTNSKGIYDYEYDYNFSGFTVVMLGDSMTQGTQVNFKERYSKILEEKLLSKSKNIRIINCGIANTGTDQQYMFLKNECIKYNPELIILYFFVGNDFTDNYASLLFSYENGKLIDKTPIKFSFLQRMLHWANTRFNTVRLTERMLQKNNITKKLLFNLGFYKSPANNNKDYYKIFFLDEDKEITNIGYEKTFLIINELSNYTKNQNVQLIIAIIPTREQVDDGKFNEYFHGYNYAEILKPNRKLINYLNANNITYIDFLPYLKQKNKNNTFYYEHDGHLNKEGHKLVADVTFNEFGNSGIINKKY
ncbi:hypothetical protein HYX02_01060 [Candidatus Woesearchaeota archaeon]|nr:hypothetical protein [Candidatus Woesearchaeota archaeon]